MTHSAYNLCQDLVYTGLTNQWQLPEMQQSGDDDESSDDHQSL